MYEQIRLHKQCHRRLEPVMTGTSHSLVAMGYMIVQSVGNKVHELNRAEQDNMASWKAGPANDANLAELSSKIAVGFALLQMVEGHIAGIGCCLPSSLQLLELLDLVAFCVSEALR